MLKEYIYGSTDESFDYGDFPGGTCYRYTLHGFKADIDEEKGLLLKTLEGLGDFKQDIEQNKGSYKTFYKWLVNSLQWHNKKDECSTPVEDFYNLIKQIEEKICSKSYLNG